MKAIYPLHPHCPDCYYAFYPYGKLWRGLFWQICPHCGWRGLIRFWHEL